MKRYFKRAEAGDTIVEVLISIAIVSLVLTAAYVTASHNTRSIEDAQERSQALQLAQRQVELLKASSPTLSPGVAECYTQSNTLVAAAHYTPGDQCRLQADGTPASATFEPAYLVDIIKSTSPPPGAAVPLYTVKVAWNSLISGDVVNGSGDNLTLYYRP